LLAASQLSAGLVQLKLLAQMRFKRLLAVVGAVSP
jgi:hypothetical protein